MSRLRRRLFASSLIFGVVVLIGSGAALLRAQESDAPPIAEPGDPATLGSPADEGALTWDDLVVGPVPSPTEEEIAAGSMTPERYFATTRETRAANEQTQGWAEADHSSDVHAAYQTYTSAMQAEAAIRHAEYEAGLTGGLGELGVVP